MSRMKKKAGKLKKDIKIAAAEKLFPIQTPRIRRTPRAFS